MTRHSTSFQIERLVSSPEAAPQLLPRSPDPAPPVTSKSRLRQLLMASAAVALLAGGSWLGWDYWTVSRFQVSTDDAYVKADTTVIAPKVSGYLREVLVGDNEPVVAGQVLARIDERDFAVALEQAKADVAAARAVIASKQAQLDTQRTVIDAARATLDVDNATATFAEQENKRYTDLASTGYGSVQNAQQAQSRIAGARAATARDSANLASAIKQVDLLKAEINQATAALARTEATRSQAELNLGYTTITAPIDGIVGNRTLRVGQFVQAGTQLMAVVPLDAVYVVANFKETQLTHVRNGQPVEVRIDSFHGIRLKGHVDSLSPASGLEFALLPPDNATGNFTKIVQRVPVKIVLDDHSLTGLLRPGMSAEPTVNTKATAAAERDATSRIASRLTSARPSGG